MPGCICLLGPPTLRTLTWCSVSQWRTPSKELWSRRDTSKSGRSYRQQKLRVAFVPGSIGKTRYKINVASLSLTFHSVRIDLGTSGVKTLRSCGVSARSRCAGISPSSHTRPGGHHPPISRPHKWAAQRAAWSTPVCPPEMILVSCPVMGGGDLSNGDTRIRFCPHLSEVCLPCDSIVDHRR